MSHTHLSDSLTHVRAAGTVTVHNAPALRGALIDLISEGHVRLILDLTSVAFLDSTGLGVLLGGLKRCRKEGGDLVLVLTDLRTSKILRVTGLIRAVGVYPDAARAAEALARTAAGPR
ncbi:MULTISPECIES: STAS domain-containing protein [unclassified Streptomyces]|uniref:STAS domain-containing protein n=1 Tax=unclassified Streptomyces TaxID=2593676 RepID=UPI003810E44A